MKTLAIAALLLAGCGELHIDASKVVPPPPRADEAIKLVSGLYGMSYLPTTYWYGRGLDCNGGYGYIDQTGTCVGGDQLDDKVIVILPPGALIGDVLPGYTTSDLAHEFAHQASDERGEGGCADHKCHWFTPGGEADQATSALMAAGM